MKIFALASYSDHVDYETGQVFPAYKEWLEDILVNLEQLGHTVFCALRADDYKINDADPTAAFHLDMGYVQDSDALLALLSEKPSVGVQTEVGVGIALKKRVILAHLPEHRLAYFNAAMVRTGVAEEIELPLTPEKIAATFPQKPAV